MASPEKTSTPDEDATGGSIPGLGIADYLPVPTDLRPVTDPTIKDTSNTLADDTTLSHALATDDHEEKGRAQEQHEQPEVRDLGWNERKQDIEAPLVGGISNEELWLLVRRFDKVGSSLCGPAALALSSLTHAHSSKCIMSRNIRTPSLETSISTLPTRRNSPRISYVPIWNGCTPRLLLACLHLLSTSLVFGRGGRLDGHPASLQSVCPIYSRSGKSAASILILGTRHTR